jgi:ATP-dependent Clp protease ATP-binding subunit ClpA
MFELSTPLLALILIIVATVFYFFVILKTPHGVTKNKTGGPTPFLDQYTTDFTALARAGKIDIVIGREDEVR